MDTIDLTDKYASATDQRLDTPYGVELNIVHHAAGWYGPPLGADDLRSNEIAQINRMAADHRDRFGTGPAYNYIAFPSGRLYAVRKWGLRGVHTKGYSPTSGRPWNVAGRAVCAMGNWQDEDPPQGTVDAVIQALREMSQIRGTHNWRDSWAGHKDVPTLAAPAAAVMGQGTACPGDRLLAALKREIYTPTDDPDTELARVKARLTEADALIASTQGHLKAVAGAVNRASEGLAIARNNIDHYTGGRQ